jgi:hypothetical protein
MLFRGDFGSIIHIDINPPLYVTKTRSLVFWFFRYVFPLKLCMLISIRLSM